MDDDPDTDAEGEVPGASVTSERRRFARFGEVIPVPTLIDQSLRAAELQLLDAREALKDARRRVVQLEDALEGWRAVREQMARAGVEASRVAVN